ncbi:MAG TPA: hypothetical protein VEC95_07580 [Terriglobales bacterium]|nr:hypothetical protein [Terriglobales bacterium]
MFRRLSAVFVLLTFALSAWADSKSADAKSAPQASRRPMSHETRLYVIRGLQSEMVYARTSFPMGTKGLTLHEDGTITPSAGELNKEMMTLGPALRPGDRANITMVRIFKTYILFELNGGPHKGKKWYEHIDVGVGGAPSVTKTQDQPPENPRGTLLILAFKDFVPEMSPEAIKQMMQPVLDFSSTSAAQAYLETIPPKAKEAIKNHEVLVGMDQDMVVYSKGRPARKIRENDDKGKPYEEWIYGEPPQDVVFVRFRGQEVVQVKIMKVDGQKIVRTEKEIDLKEVREAEARKREEEKPAAKPQPVANRPTLKRPGEEDDPAAVHTTAPSAPQAVDPNEHDPTLGRPPAQQPNPAPAPPAPQNPAPQDDLSTPGRWMEPASL